MTVLKGEGKVSILFGSTSIQVASRVRSGYLARPDHTGEWPTVVVVPPAGGITPSIKDLCRRLARRELASVALDSRRGTPRPRPRATPGGPRAVEAAPTIPPDDLDDAVDDVASFVTNRAGFWSSAERGLGVLGMGAGGSAAARLAWRRPGLAVALVSTPLAPVAEALGSAAAVLGVYARDDADVPVDEVVVERSRLPNAELVIYDGVGAGFMDDDSPGFDFEVANDAVDRLVAFFLRHLPRGPAPGDVADQVVEPPLRPMPT